MDISGLALWVLYCAMVLLIAAGAIALFQTPGKPFYRNLVFWITGIFGMVGLSLAYLLSSF